MLYSRAIQTGKIQEMPPEVIDLGFIGFLGVGAIDGLADGTGSLKMYHTQQETNQPSRIQTVQWGGDTGLNIEVGESLVWDGNSSYQSSSWTVVDSPTPGTEILTKSNISKRIVHEHRRIHMSCSP